MADHFRLLSPSRAVSLCLRVWYLREGSRTTVAGPVNVYFLIALDIGLGKNKTDGIKLRQLEYNEKTVLCALFESYFYVTYFKLSLTRDKTI